MRTLSTLAVLFLGLAVVFWAPAAKAHCPGHEHCDEEPSLTPPVVVDSTGAVVGQVNGRTSVASVAILIRLDDGRLVTGLQVEAHEPNKMPFGEELRSVSVGCEGPFFVETGDLAAMFLPFATVGPDDWLYIADDLSGAGPVTTDSSWNSKLKLCTDVEQTGPTSVQFDPVMQLNFVPPFHIE